MCVYNGRDLIVGKTVCNSLTPTSNEQRQGATKASRIYILTVGIFLIVVSSAKLWSTFGTAGILTTEDPVFGISFRVLLVVAAVFELAIGLVCLWHSNPVVPAALTAWFGLSVLIYRVGMFMAGWEKPCPCLGSLTDALHLSPSTAETTAHILLTYFLVGSCAIVAANWRQRGRLKLLSREPI
jgi:hypothetical protein